MTMPLESYIPVPSYKMEETILHSRAHLDQNGIKQVFSLLEALIHHERQTELKRLRALYDIFSAQSENVWQKQHTRTQLNEMEFDFLQQFIRVLHEADFHVLSRSEWDYAKADDFNFTLPVSIRWEELDRDLFSKYLAVHKDFRASAAPFSDRVMIFKRGVGIAKKRGMFFSQKLDLLAEYALYKPLASFWNQHKDKLPAFITTAFPNDKVMTMETAEDSIFLERRTLRAQLPNLRSVLDSFSKQMEISEPTFKHVVVMYRELLPVNIALAGGSTVSKAVEAVTSEEPVQVAEPTAPGKPTLEPIRPPARSRQINIKSFWNVPMADLEMVLPEKKINIKLVHIVQLFATFMLGLYAFLSSFSSDEKGNSSSSRVFLLAVSVLVVRAVSMWQTIQSDKLEISEAIHKTLYKSTMDTQGGVINYVISAMEEQELKESMLIYTLLTQHPAGIDQGGLNTMAEHYLLEHYGISVLCDLEPTVNRLKTRGLVRMENNLLHAVPISQALVRLDERWDNIFQYYHGNQSSQGQVQGQAALPSSNKTSSFVNRVPSKDVIQLAEPPIRREPSSSVVHEISKLSTRTEFDSEHRIESSHHGEKEILQVNRPVPVPLSVTQQPMGAQRFMPKQSMNFETFQHETVVAGHTISTQSMAIGPQAIQQSIQEQPSYLRPVHVPLPTSTHSQAETLQSSKSQNQPAPLPVQTRTDLVRESSSSPPILLTAAPFVPIGAPMAVSKIDRKGSTVIKAVRDVDNQSGIVSEENFQPTFFMG
eukprot:GILJ01018009.1.p1 GENE.GILJ01018009.1~~GILJ01018009.1.p1  ORF type:complete len:764 (+),score=139.32 GILJ01018009.1:403-2694(+)